MSEAGTPWVAERHARSLARLLRDLPRGSRLLILGHVEPPVVERLLDAGHDLIARGTAEDLAEIHAWGAHARLRCEQDDPCSLPHPPRAFEAALALGLVERTPGWPTLVTELCRVARHAVIVEFEGPHSLGSLASGHDLPARVRASELREAFEKLGFRVRQVRPQRLLPREWHARFGSRARLLEGPARVLGLTRLFGSPVLMRADRFFAHESLAVRKPEPEPHALPAAPLPEA